MEYRTTFGESQLMALSFARPVASGNEIRRGRWYVEPGFALVSYNSAGDLVAEYGLKAGFRADTRMFGYVDLYLLATRDTTLGIHLVDLPTRGLRQGDTVIFTFHWPGASRWEGADFTVLVTAPYGPYGARP